MESSTEEELFVLQKVREIFPNCKFQKGFLAYNKSFIIVDIYIPKPYYVVIEVDGNYHDNIEMINKDQTRDQWLLDKRNVKVIRIKNADVHDFDYESAIIENARFTRNQI